MIHKKVIKEPVMTTVLTNSWTLEPFKLAMKKHESVEGTDILKIYYQE